MPVTELLLEGLRLMIIGMGIVFAFLLLLVGVLRQMSIVARRLAPEPHGPSDVAQAAGAASTGVSANSELAAVITAAVARYRRDR